MNRFTKAASVFAITASMTAGSLAMTAPQANAGLLIALTARGQVGFEVGAIVAVVGLLTLDPFLLLLGADGNISADQLTAKIASDYPQLDRLSAGDLAKAVTEKARVVPSDDSGRKLITLDRNEVSQAMRASNVEFAQPDLFEQIASSLK